VSRQVRLTPRFAGLTPAGPQPRNHVVADAGSLLASEFHLAWRRGERPTVEQFLARSSATGGDAELAIQLICEEICLRQESGEPVDAGELLTRFPQWRAELELLLACDQVFQDEAPPAFPDAGDELGDFRLVTEVGRGATSRVFLARQTVLSDRPMVLKFTSFATAEHLSLARLQHTGIVPLYLVQDFPARGLRALCMPYLGGASLDALLAELKDQPPEERSGRSLVAALDGLQVDLPVALPTPAADEQFLADCTYVEAVCWIGASLADALHYAHQRGLVHLDLKPSNVLLASDRQPMLLDFHLARSPLPAGAPAHEWLGGTPGFMSPEQAAALAAIREGRQIDAAVDARSDIYSLGVLLYELLGGRVTADDVAGPRPPLGKCNRHVSRGLEDVLGKCLQSEPGNRYADAAGVADDLRRHLADLPLRGVANRSLTERWRKWRRRKPRALARLATGAVLAVALIGGGLSFVGRQVHDAERALLEGDDLLDYRVFPAAIDRLQSGLDRLVNVPGQAELNRSLTNRLASARRRRLAADLHQLVERMRFLDGADWLPVNTNEKFDDGCRTIWAAREWLLGQFAAPTPDGTADAHSTDAISISTESASAVEVRTDLLDLAILWSGLRVRLASGADVAARRHQALQRLAEAESALGSNPVLDHERHTHLRALSGSGSPPTLPSRARETAPLSVWEHGSLGRRLLHDGELDAAADELQLALDEAPQSFWPNYHQGVCRYRQGRYDDALKSFYVCVALAPTSAECFYNRGLAHTALRHENEALNDFSRALRLEPHFAAAALHRAVLYGQDKQFESAAADLKRAAADGADLGEVHYQWALLHLARHEREAAIDDLRAALSHSPGHHDALTLLDRLRQSRSDDD